MKTIVAFDPGETTGYAVGQWYGGKDFTLKTAGELRWEDRFTILGMLQVHMPDYIVIEEFRLYQHRAMSQIGKVFPSSIVIGIIQAYTYQLGLLDRITMQPASVRSSVKITSDVGSSMHVRDAYKHLRYFVIVNLLKKGVVP